MERNKNKKILFVGCKQSLAHYKLKTDEEVIFINAYDSSGVSCLSDVEIFNKIEQQNKKNRLSKVVFEEALQGIDTIRNLVCLSLHLETDKDVYDSLLARKKARERRRLNNREFKLSNMMPLAHA